MVIILLVLILVIAAVIGYIAYRLAEYMVHPAYISLEKARQVLEEQNLLSAYDAFSKETYEVTSYDGYKLSTVYIPAETASDKYVIISHGYSYNRYGSVKYVLMFRTLGYNCIIYDNRGHGENPPVNCTMGLNESRDLMEMIRDTYERYGRDIYLGLHGESMGSGLEIMALKYQPNVKFIVNDCGYGKLIEVLKHKAKQLFHMPAWMVYIASVVCKAVYGYYFQEVEPMRYLRENTIPICFIHGKADDFIDYHHSIWMNDATKSYHELHLVEGADHAQALDVDKEGYYAIVERFLEKIS